MEEYTKYKILDSFVSEEKENNDWCYFLELEDVGLVCTNDKLKWEEAIDLGFIELSPVIEDEEGL